MQAWLAAKQIEAWQESMHHITLLCRCGSAAFPDSAEQAPAEAGQRQQRKFAVLDSVNAERDMTWSTWSQGRCLKFIAAALACALSQIQVDQEGSSMQSSRLP